MECEFDARMHSRLKTYEYLLELGFTSEEIAIIEDKSLEEEILENMYKNRNIKYDDLFQINSKDINNFFIDALNEDEVDFLKIISLAGEENYVERENLFQRYPIFRHEFEYSENGYIVKKSKEKMQKELDKILENTIDEKKKEKIIAFYNEIMNSEKNKQDESKSFITFLEENGYEVDEETKTRLQSPESITLLEKKSEERSNKNGTNNVDSSYLKTYYLKYNAEDRENVKIQIEKLQEHTDYEI